MSTKDLPSLRYTLARYSKAAVIFNLHDQHYNSKAAKKMAARLRCLIAMVEARGR